MQRIFNCVFVLVFWCITVKYLASNSVKYGTCDRLVAPLISTVAISRQRNGHAACARGMPRSGKWVVNIFDEASILGEFRNRAWAQRSPQTWPELLHSKSYFLMHFIFIRNMNRLCISLNGGYLFRVALCFVHSYIQIPLVENGNMDKIMPSLRTFLCVHNCGSYAELCMHRDVRKLCIILCHVSRSRETWNFRVLAVLRIRGRFEPSLLPPFSFSTCKGQPLTYLGFLSRALRGNIRKSK